MRAIKVISIGVIVIVAALWVLGLLIGVWLPDVVFAPRRTLAYEKLPSGYTFSVVQYWNRVDFYSTELHIVSPDARNAVHVLDGDDSKSWSLPMSVDPGVVTVT